MQHFTANVMVGDLLLECFFSAKTFLELSEGANSSFTEEHSHASYELLICRRGSGFQFVDNCAHTYGEHSVFLFAPFTKHAHISSAQSPEIRCSIRFEVAKEQPFAEGSRGDGVLKHLNQQGFLCFDGDADLMATLQQLAELSCSDAPQLSFLVGGVLAQLMGQVFRQISLSICQWQEAADWSSSADLSRRKFLIDHFFDQLVNRNARIEDLCQEVHLSPSQLNRVIREIFGMTFKQKLIEVRIAYIKYFLKYSDMPISEIAQRSNFLENSNFSLFFKQHCGETPSQYRARERARQESLPGKK